MYFLNKKQQNKSINKKLLVVQLNHKKDLQIQWNFSGMLMPKAYRRHVFISLSSEKAQVLKAYNKTRACFQYFKFGDLYTFGNPSDRNLAWFEKTKIDPFRSSFCMQSMKNQLNQQYQTYRQLKSLSKFKQPCLVVLFCDPQQQVSQVERFLAAIKQKCNLSIFVFVISAHYH